MQDAVDKTKVAYKKWQKDNNPQDLVDYRSAKRETKRAVAIAKATKMRDMVEDMKLDEKPQEIFRAARQMTKQGLDIETVNCLKNDTGKLVVDEEEIKSTWKTYMEKIMNEENVWDKDIVSEMKQGPACKIKKEEVASALKKMKMHKAPGVSGVSAEMLMAVEDISVEWLTEICNGIVEEKKIPEDLKSSILVPVYTGKGDPLACGSYRGIKLLEHAMKVIERVLEGRIRDQIDIDEMQFGFMPGRGTTDAIFIVRQLQEK